MAVLVVLSALSVSLLLVLYHRSVHPPPHPHTQVSTPPHPPPHTHRGQYTPPRRIDAASTTHRTEKGEGGEREAERQRVNERDRGGGGGGGGGAGERDEGGVRVCVCVCMCVCVRAHARNKVGRYTKCSLVYNTSRTSAFIRES